MAGLLKIKSLIGEACSQYVYSGYQLWFEQDRNPQFITGGIQSYWGTAKKITGTTLFDIGSLTKVVATTSILATAVQRGEIQLSTSLSHWLPELKPTSLGVVSILHLLSHSSGLKGWTPIELYKSRDLLSWFRVRADTLMIHKPGERLVYSDLGFLLLGLVIERALGPLKKLFETRVAHPLNMKRTIWGRVGASKAAATEYCSLRGRLVQGEVFDENSHALGGICAHAGLFSTASDLAQFCREWIKALIGKSSWLSADIATQFITRAKLVEGSTWALGWDTKSKLYSSAGERFSESSFGHLGYTGCSIWIDYRFNRFAIFLTNRIHPSRFDERIKKLRPRVHNEIVEYWTRNGRS